MRNERLYLVDIVEAAEAIETFIHGVDAERFVCDDLVRSAVLHKLTVIGEVADMNLGFWCEIHVWNTTRSSTVS